MVCMVISSTHKWNCTPKNPFEESIRGWFPCPNCSHHPTIPKQDILPTPVDWNRTNLNKSDITRPLSEDILQSLWVPYQQNGRAISDNRDCIHQNEEN